MHFLDRVQAASSRAVAIGAGIEVRLEDRLQHQLGSGLHHPVPDRRDAERALAAAGLRDQDPSHRCRPIRLLDQVRSEPGEPLFPPRRFDHREAHPVHPRRTRIRARQVVGVAQDVFPINLVVEQVEAEVRLRLRLEIQLPLKPPDAIGCLQAHRQSPILVFFGSTPEVRVLSSTGVTRLHRSYDPVRLPPTPPPFAASRSLPSCRTGLPRLLASPFQRAVPTAPADRDGCFCRLLPHPTRAFPVMQAGRHPRLHFRGLLRLHACYGPLDRSTAQSGLRHEASTRPVTRPSRSSATRSYRQLPGWLLPPLVIRAVGAHCIKQAKQMPDDHRQLARDGNGGDVIAAPGPDPFVKGT